MKNKFIIISVIFGLMFGTNNIVTNYINNFEVISANASIIDINISIGEILLDQTNINNETYTTLSLNNSYPSTQTIGMPNIPTLNQLIEIPHEATIRIEIIEDKTSLYDLSLYGFNSQIIPVQEPVSKSSNPEQIAFQKNEDIYRDNLYKKELIQIQDKGMLRKVRIGNILISPIEYNPVDNKIIVHENIKIRLHLENANISLTNQNKTSYYSPYFEPIYEQFLPNYINPVFEETRDNIFMNDVVSYLIIADPSFENSLGPFVNWKTEKGFYVNVAYTNDIGSSANSIKNYLQNQYNNPPNNMPPPSFVLLVGDTPQIPASYSSGGHVSDLDYCDFSNDNIPDVLCGRFSGQNISHITAQIEKTLEYEQYLMPDPSFLGDVLMISGVDSNYAPTYGNGQINYGNSYYFNSQNDINSNTYLYPASGSAESQILNTANQGVGFINYTAHGWESGWADPEFNITDVNNMTNTSQYPTMIGNCCLTNAFDDGSCFGEALLRKSNAGAIGYIGGSDVTYWDEDFWWGVGSGNVSANPSFNNYGPGAYDGMFHQNNEANWAIVNSAIIMLGNLAVAQANGMDDYYWEIYHLMGDPSLSTFLGVPSNNNVIHDVFLPVGAEAIEIQANPFSYVGLTQNGELLSAGTVDNSGFLVLVFNSINDPGTLTLTVTGQNTIPYIGEIFVASPDGAYTTVNNVEIVNANDDIIAMEETITIQVTLENVGSEIANDVIISLNNSNSDPYLQFITNQVIIDNLPINQIITEELSFYISNDSPYGHEFNISLSLVSNESNWESTYSLMVEPLIEGFSSASFNDFLWEFSGDENWVIDGNNFLEDSYSAQSGTIDHNMTSELFITMDIVEDGQIKFDKRVSCEDVGAQSGNYYDYLAFYIDGEEQGKWAGEISWSQNSFSVSAGEHTFLWKYNKDQGVTSGDDAAWIDNIIFPPSFYASILFGDVNDDGNINIQDVILTVNIILDSLNYNQAADLNEDGNIDVLDVISIVNLILQ